MLKVTDHGEVAAILPGERYIVGHWNTTLSRVRELIQ